MKMRSLYIMNMFKALFAILMVMAVIFTVAAVPVFADTAEVVEHDHDGDGVADHGDDAHATTVNDGWTTLGTSDYIALVVAAVILVAFVVAIVLLVPKKSKHK